MPVFENRVVYRTGDRFWENVWNIDTGTHDDVPPEVTVALEDFAIATLLNLFSVDRIVRRPAGSHDEFVEVLVGAAGALAVGSNLALPLFNVVRVLFQPAAGRPGVKYLRGILTNASLVDEQNHIDGGSISLIQGDLNALMNSISTAGCNLVIGSAEKVAITGVVQSIVQMRQQHRKRKKSLA